MKKVLLLSMTFFILLFTGCKKEKTELSEFIVGDWTTGELILSGGQEGEIFITFSNSNEYILSVSMAPAKNGAITGSFEIDNKARMLTLESDELFRLFGFESSGDPIMFNVEFSTTGDVDKMTLTLTSLPAAAGGIFPLVILTRITGLSS
ncbi:MAG: hypothetical protein GX126_07605 [Bacteroidales bacterium]|jgi:hypothetical protein|nr:hypothetical protein [Bacteroidales bacterium]